jgi:hypothetical protein
MCVRVAGAKEDGHLRLQVTAQRPVTLDS